MRISNDNDGTGCLIFLFLVILFFVYTIRECSKPIDCHCNCANQPGIQAEKAP